MKKILCLFVCLFVCLEAFAEETELKPSINCDFNKVKDVESTRAHPRTRGLSGDLKNAKDAETKKFWEELSKEAKDPNKRKAINEAAKNIPNELKKKEERERYLKLIETELDTTPLSVFDGNKIGYIINGAFVY